MNRLLVTTAAVALLAAGSGVSAQTAAPATDTGFMQTVPEGDMFASNLIGMRLYASATEISANQPVTADARAGMDDIGEIGDLVVDAKGQVQAVIVDIGGFLGMGEHTVAVNMSRINVMTDDSGDRFAAIAATKDSLEAAPEFTRPDITAPAAPGAAGMGTGVGLGATATDATAPALAPAAAPSAEMTGRDGYMPMAAQDLTAERLDGADVYGPGDEKVGEVGKLILDSSGQITQAVVDVGGFLGIGEHSVALNFDEMHVMNDAKDNEVRVYIDATKDDLKNRPEYKG